MLSWCYQMANAANICESCGVRLRGKKHRTQANLAPKETFSTATIRSIAKHYGDDHACRVLECIIFASHNEDQLYGDTIRAVSMWIISSGFDERDAALVNDYMSTISLSVLRCQVKEIPLPDRPLRMCDRLHSGFQDDQMWRPAA